MDVTYFIATYSGAKVQRASAQQRARYGKRFGIGLVLLYSNFQVQRLAWNLWIRINLLIRHILMIRHECCVSAIFGVSKISQPPFFYLQE